MSLTHWSLNPYYRKKYYFDWLLVLYWPLGCVFIFEIFLQYCNTLCYTCWKHCQDSTRTFISNQIKCIYIALHTSADISKCYTETQPKTPNSKQCSCRSTVARKNSLERQKPRKKPREEPGYEGLPVLFCLCRVEIITEHGQDVQMFIKDQPGQIIIITVVVESAIGQHLRSKCQLAFHSRSLRVSLPLLLSLESWQPQVWDR